jgi:hypothetical protein
VAINTWLVVLIGAGERNRTSDLLITNQQRTFPRR